MPPSGFVTRGRCADRDEYSIKQSVEELIILKRNVKIPACVCAVVLTGLLTVPAMAHSHHGSPVHHSASYPVCQTEDCQLTCRHSHDGVTYCAHTRDDGHEWHGVCEEDDCTHLGEHTHRTGRCGRHC